jgi:SAM-dependent methyltransferase
MSVEFAVNPTARLTSPFGTILSFLSDRSENIDWDTVSSFGEEWSKFDQFTENEIEKIGDEYFDLLRDDMVSSSSTVALDVGCGTGRWSQYLSQKVARIEAIDPSEAVFSARKALASRPNVRVSQADVDNIPFHDATFDFVFSLGVLHHIPDTAQALAKCVAKLKPGGWFLVYLYYCLDNRGFAYRALFKLAHYARGIICQLPKSLKQGVCEVIAFGIYWPLSRAAGFFSRRSTTGNFGRRMPLFYYADKSLKVMRNDALDRFGTPLEQRFSKSQITAMMEAAGLTNIRFSERAPFWHAVGQKL